MTNSTRAAPARESGFLLIAGMESSTRSKFLLSEQAAFEALAPVPTLDGGRFHLRTKVPPTRFGALRYSLMNGIELTQLWGADRTMTYPDAGDPAPFTAFFAPVGGFRFVAFTIPPNAAAAPADDDAALAAVESRFPGLLATMDPDNPGMHRSATIDLIYCIEGRIVLELDDGSETSLNAGDVVVQSGTMHAWRNPWDEPCRLVAVIVGADYDAP